MKIFPFLLVAFSGLAFAAPGPDRGAASADLAPCDRAGIRAAYETARHAARDTGGGKLSARNPGQGWAIEFDGGGFTVAPDHKAWTWGLDLTGYGDCTFAASPTQLRQDEGKITCRRDENLTEWFINDVRGLEQGWDIQRRPERPDDAAPLYLHLSTRGTVSAEVSPCGRSISFGREDGGTALNYGGLKAWDADGKALAVRFEQGEGNNFRIAVSDQGARYPVSIDPVAQETTLTAGNVEAWDRFGFAVAVSG